MGEQHDRPMLKIGQLARRWGLNPRTLRYYESIGLLPPPPRTEGCYRLYSEEDERRLQFVLQAKHLGFSLDEIRRILELGHREAPCAYVRETLGRHLAALDERINALERLRAELAAMATAWQEQGDVAVGRICALIEQWSL
jgi:DNA-binding transcriptional MerR regulator